MEAKTKTSPLLTNYKMGKFNLSHRVVLPPLTRNRAFNNTPQAHGVEYYSQRATNGGLLISEAAAATDISIRCPNMPGIWTEKQVEAWKPIVEEVHSKGGIIFCQIWHPARISNYTFAPEGSEDLIKPISNKKVGGDYHSFDITSRRSHTPTKEGNVAPHAYKIIDREEAVASSLASISEDGSVASDPYILFDGEEAAASSLANTSEDGNVAPHAYILFDREEAVANTSEDRDVAQHAYILFDREEAVVNTSEDGNVAPHAYILFDREEAVVDTSEDGNVAPNAYILFDREEAVASSLANTTEDGNVAPHAYILFDREEAVANTSEDGNVAPHAYILFDREEAVASSLANTSKDGNIAPHAYILFDREEAAANILGSASADRNAYLLLDRDDGVALPVSSVNGNAGAAHPLILLDRNEACVDGKSGAAHPLILLDRNEAHTVPLLIADRVSATTTNDRELDLDHKGVVSDKLSIEKSQSIINDFVLAARNAIKAGFDGVEINCAHGYLIERHLNERVKNNTPDPYGGSIEKRCGLALDVVQAVSNEIGSERVGIKLSPFDDFHGSGNLSPVSVGTYLATQLNNLGLVYLHVTEPRMIKTGDGFKTPRSLQSIREAFDGTLIASGGYDKSDGDVAVAQDYADLVSFGRLFVANPDLVKRFELNAPLNKHDRSTFYVPEPVVGYTDYPSLEIVA